MTRRRTKLPRRTQLWLIEHFVAGTTARMAADLVQVNRNTATLYYRKLREVVTERIADESPFGGEIEIDESYFGGHRKGKRGHGAAGKTVVFGILKRGGRVYTAVPPNLKRATLLPIIRQRVEPDSLVITDGLNVSRPAEAGGIRSTRRASSTSGSGTRRRWCSTALTAARCTPPPTAAATASRTSGVRRSVTCGSTMGCRRAISSCS